MHLFWLVKIQSLETNRVTVLFYSLNDVTLECSSDMIIKISLAFIIMIGYIVSLVAFDNGNKIHKLSYTTC